MTFGAPVVIDCDYSAKAERVTRSNGVEFVAKMTIYTERATIQPGDRIMLGASSATDPIAAGADEVQAVDRFADTFARQADDYAVRV